MATPIWFDKVYYLNSKLAQLVASGDNSYADIVALDVAIEAAGFDAFSHFQAFSLVERTSPNPYFNAGEYLTAKAAQANATAVDGKTNWTADSIALAIKDAGIATIWDHFVEFGWKEGVNPSNAFDVSTYFADKLAQLQADEPAAGWTDASMVAAFEAAGLDPVTHFQMFGTTEGLSVTGVPAAEQVGGGSPVPSDPTVGETFTLTTGVDNVVGTSGNDTILGSNDVNGTGDITFNVGDVINGGSGVDTLVIATDADVLTFNARTVTSVENLTVLNGYEDFDTLNLGNKAFDTVTVDYAGTNMYDDLYIDGIKADTDLVVQNIQTDGYYVYRNDSGVYSTLAGSVTQNNTFKDIDYSVNDDYLEFDNYAYFAQATELNLTNTLDNLITGGTTSTGSDEWFGFYDYIEMEADNATINLTYNFTDVLQPDNYSGISTDVYNGATADVADVVNAVVNVDNVDGLEIHINNSSSGTDSDSDVFTLNVASGGYLNTYGGNYFDLDDFETLNFTIDGDTELETVDAYSNVTAAQTINIVANADFTIADVFDEADDQEVTVNISGAGDVTIDFNGDNHGFTLNGGTATGDLDLTVGSDYTYATVVTTGSGDDIITLDNAFELNTAADAFLQVIDGGDGTDTFEIDTDDLVASQALLNTDVTDFSDAIKNFERLSLSAFSTQAIDAITLGFNHVTIDGYTTGGSLTVEDASTVVVTDTGTTGAAIIVDGAATGTQSVNLVVEGEDGITLNALTVADVETINIVSSASDPDAITPGANTVDLIAAAATTLNISGATELVFGATADFANVATVAAGAFDAGLTIDLTSSTVATTVTVGDGDNTITGNDDKANTITAGSGDNTITGGSAIDTITTGAGYDTIVADAGNDVISTGNGGSQITGGAGKDTITLGSGAEAEDIDTLIFADESDSQGTTVDVINGFQVAVQATTDTNADDIVDATDIINDVLDLSFVVMGAATYAGEANGYGAVLTSLTGDVANSQAVLDTSTSTLYVDIDANGVLDSSDMAIQLTGVTDLSTANFAFV